MLILPLPQLMRCSRATCRRACMLLSWAWTRISCSNLRDVRTVGYTVGFHGFVNAGPRGPRVGEYLRAPPYEYLTPLHRRREPRGSTSGTSPPIDGDDVAPPSEPGPVGFTKLKVSSSPLMSSGAISASGKSKRS